METALTITTNGQGSLVVSSIDYAAGLDIQHKNLLETIRTHKEAIEADFGGVAFETRTLDTEGGKQQIKVAYLTEDQALFIGTLSRNSKRVIEFKATLVRSFSQARQLQQPAEVAQPAAPSLTEQLMLQLVQQNAAVLQNQQVILDRLQSDIASIQRGGKKGKPQPRQLALPLSAPEQMPNDNKELRRSINYHINEYCGRVGCNQQEAYRYLYKRLQAVYGFNVYQCGRGVNETVMEAVERYGQLDRLYSLVRAELAYQE